MGKLGHPRGSWGILGQLGILGSWGILGKLEHSRGSWGIPVQLGHPEEAASYVFMAGFFPDCCCGLRVSGATLWHNLLSFLSFPMSPTSCSLHISPAGRKETESKHAHFKMN